MSFDSWNLPNQFNPQPTPLPTFSQPQSHQPGVPNAIPQFKPPTAFSQPPQSASTLPSSIKPFTPLPSSLSTQSFTPNKPPNQPNTGGVGPIPTFNNPTSQPGSSFSSSQNQFQTNLATQIKPFQPLPTTFNANFQPNAPTGQNVNQNLPTPHTTFPQHSQTPQSSSAIPQFKSPSTFSPPATFTPSKPSTFTPQAPINQPQPRPFVPLEQPNTSAQNQQPANTLPAFPTFNSLQQPHTFSNTTPPPNPQNQPPQPPSQFTQPSTFNPSGPMQPNLGTDVSNKPGNLASPQVPVPTHQTRFSEFGTGNVDDYDSDGLKTPPPESASLLSHPALSSAPSTITAPQIPPPTPSNPFPQYAHEDDIPLLEELGIDLSLIFKKTKQIIKLPFSPALRTQLSTTLSHTTNSEYDLTGPLVFCLLLGCLLMVLQGKIHFGYIYGYTLVGCVGLWFLCNVLCDYGINIDIVFHVIGYSLAPLLLLPPIRFIGLNILHKWIFSLQILSFLAIISSTVIATLYFECVIHLQSQRYIIAYPIAMFYFCFVLLIMF